MIERKDFMFKKMMFFACAFIAANVFAAPDSNQNPSSDKNVVRKENTKKSKKKVEYKQTSLKEAVECFYVALVEDDRDAFWRLIAPGARKIMMQEWKADEARAKEIFCNKVFSGYDKNNNAILKVIFADNEKKEKFLTHVLNTQAAFFVKVDNKWYFDPVKAATK